MSEQKISAAHLRKLEAYARRLRSIGAADHVAGTTNIGATRYTIELQGAGYRVAAINGKAPEAEA